jgi:hypothetical protein
MKEPLDATAIRRAGESADGNREVDMVFAAAADGDVIFTSQQDADAHNLEVRLRVKTGFSQPGLRSKVRVVLIYDGKLQQLDEKVDAVFLTQSSVEKFVLPYYTRHCQPKEIQGLRDSLFDDAHCIAARHVPPSVTSAVPEFAPVNEIQGIDERGELWAPIPAWSESALGMPNQSAKHPTADALK